MKYSQAIIVACIGSAALVSAVPTPQVNELEARNPKPKPAVAHVRNAGTSLKKAGSSAVRAAGGGQVAAQHLGSLASLYQTHKATTSSNEGRSVTESEVTTPVAKEGTSASASLTPKKKKTHHRHSAKESTTASLTPKKKKTAHHQHSAKGDQGDNIHHRIQNSAAHVTSSDITSSVAKTRTAHPKVAEAASPAAPRDLFDEGELELRGLSDEELDLRDFDEELEARFFKNFISKYRQAKAERLQKQADKAAAKVAGSSDPEQSTRDLIDEEDYIAARDLDEDLEARGIRDMFKALFHKKKAPSADTSMDPNSVRSFLEEEDLFERDFDFDLNELD